MPDLPPLFDDLTFLSPLSEDRAAGLVRFLAEGRPGSVLDIGCGWGELLLRVVAAAPEAEGRGVDIEAVRLGEARRRAEARGLLDRVTFEERDAREIAGTFDAVVCVGASHVWAPPAEEAQPLSYGPALAALRALLRPGGRLVYADAIWSRTPTAEAVSALGGRDDEFLPLHEVVTVARDSGFAVAASAEASQDEWDAFESGYVEGYERWLAAHPADHAEAAEVRERLREQRERYLNGYRGVMGMGYLTLVAA